MENESCKKSSCYSRHIVQCTPEVAFSGKMCEYVKAQTQVGRKQWVYSILSGEKELRNIKLRTDEFVLLPDIETRGAGNLVNWLAIFQDTELRTIRDLRGCHIDLLRRVKMQCVERVKKELSVDDSSIMCYFHYLPSVYQLHLHVCAPYGQYTTMDICKVQPIDNVISNLEIDSDYYQKASITTVVVGNNDLLKIYGVKQGLRRPEVDSAESASE